MAFIGKVNAGGISNAPIAATLYGTCGTAAGTQVKAVTCSDYDLTTPITGMTIHIKFTNSNTYNGTVQLNINSKGAKNAYRNGTTNIGTTEGDSWRPNAVVPFTFDGTNWIMSGGSSGISATGVTAGTYGPASDVGSTAASFKVPTIIVDETGRITHAGSNVIYREVVTLSSTTPAAVATNAIIGSSTAAARADHVHNITKATITNALGYTPPTTDSNTTYAAASSTTTIGTASVTGTSTAYARADHVHGITKATITTALGYNPISPSGLTDELDTFEESLMTTVTPSNVGTASVTGVGGTLARADHVHGITKATITTALGYTPPQQDTNTHTTVVSTTTPSGSDVVLWIDPT